MPFVNPQGGYLIGSKTGFVFFKGNSESEVKIECTVANTLSLETSPADWIGTDVEAQTDI